MNFYQTFTKELEATSVQSNETAGELCKISEYSVVSSWQFVLKSIFNFKLCLSKNNLIGFCEPIRKTLFERESRFVKRFAKVKLSL